MTRKVISVDIILVKIIEALERIYRTKYIIKGYYHKERDIMIFYEQGPGIQYLIEIEPFYILNTKTIEPTIFSPLKYEFDTDFKKIIREAIRICI